MIAYMGKGAKIRVGTDRFFRVVVLNDGDGSGVDLTKKDNVSIYVRNSTTGRRTAQECTILGNGISFQWDKSENIMTGSFDIVVEYDETNESSNTGAVHNVADIVDAFRVVPVSEQESNTDRVFVGIAHASLQSVLGDIAYGKAKLAAVITEKGVSTASDAAFETMADNIAKITIQQTPIADVTTDFDGRGKWDVLAIMNNNRRTDYPYMCAVEYDGAAGVVNLSGADAYLCSDGFKTGTSQLHDVAYDFTKSNSYVIYYFANKNYTMPINYNVCQGVHLLNGEPYIISRSGMQINGFIMQYAGGGYVATAANLALSGNGTVRCPTILANIIEIAGGDGLKQGCQLALPALATVSGGNVAYSNSNLTSLALPALATVSGGNVAWSNGNLTSLALPALATVSGSGRISQNNDKLVFVDLSNLVTIGYADALYSLTSTLGLCCDKNISSVKLDSLKRVYTNMNSATYNIISSQSTLLTDLSLPSLIFAGFLCFKNIKKLYIGGNKYEKSDDYINIASGYKNADLTSLTIGAGFAINLNLKGCDALTHDVLTAIIANLADQTTGIPLTLTLDSVLKALLTGAEIAVATNKNWNVTVA